MPEDLAIRPEFEKVPIRFTSFSQQSLSHSRVGFPVLG